MVENLNMFLALVVTCKWPSLCLKKTNILQSKFNTFCNSSSMESIFHFFPFADVWTLSFCFTFHIMLGLKVVAFYLLSKQLTRPYKLSVKVNLDCRGSTVSVLFLLILFIICLLMALFWVLLHSISFRWAGVLSPNSSLNLTNLNSDIY